jgi:hypothetical protein
MKQRPVAIGLLVCEQVIIEQGTHNVTLVNTFSRRTVKEIPSPPLSFVVTALLTDGLGEMPLEMRIERLDTLDIVSQFHGTVQFAHPLREVRCNIRVRDCSFPVAGLYEVVLFVDHEPIASKRIAIIHSEEIP